MVFMLPAIDTPSDLMIDHLTWQESENGWEVKATDEQLHAYVRFCRLVGVLALVESLGWQMVLVPPGVDYRPEWCVAFRLNFALFHDFPAHFRGRCKPPLFVRPVPKRSVKHDLTGGYNPAGEPTSLKTCLKLRQTRRLASVVYKSWSSIPPITRQTLHKEWECARRAQGFGRAWERWILTFECVPILPQGVPDLPLLHLFLEITKYETDLSVRQEEKVHRAAKKHLIQQGTKDKNGSLIFRALRETEQKVISGLQCPVSSEAKLIRLSKGTVRLLLTTHES